MTDTERLAAIIVAWLEGDQAARERALADARAALAAIREAEARDPPGGMIYQDTPYTGDWARDAVIDAERAKAQVREGNRLVREALDRQRGSKDVDPTGTDPSFASAGSGFASTVRKPVE